MFFDGGHSVGLSNKNKEREEDREGKEREKKRERSSQILLLRKFKDKEDGSQLCIVWKRLRVYNN